MGMCLCPPDWYVLGFLLRRNRAVGTWWCGDMGTQGHGDMNTW